MAKKANHTSGSEMMTELRGPWLGQETPGKHPTVFCPEVLSAKPGEDRAAGISFTSNGEEALLTVNPGSGGASGIMHMRMINGVWSRPQPASFNAQLDNDVCLSPDGKRACWRSWRPLPGNSKTEKSTSLWAADRDDDEWGEAFPVECGGKLQSGWYPGIAANGTLYFSVQASEGEYVIARAKRSGMQYEARETILRGMSPGGDLCVAPDESFLVVTRFSLPHFKGGGNLHVSFQTSDGQWTPLQDMGPVFNTELLEYCPTISADGRWLFFFRANLSAWQASAYWVDASIIDGLRPSP